MQGILSTATSTVDQVQLNIFGFFMIFFVTFITIIFVLTVNQRK